MFRLSLLILSTCFFLVGCSQASPRPIGIDSETEGCRPGEYTCSGGGQCISQDRVCDMTRDCPQGDDEPARCVGVSARRCQPNEFDCGDGNCIPDSQRCDGTTQCTATRMDEANCPADPEQGGQQGQQTCEQQGKVTCTNGGAIVCMNLVCPDGITCENVETNCPTVANGCPRSSPYLCPGNSDYPLACTSDRSLSNCYNRGCPTGQALCSDNNCYQYVCDNLCQNEPCRTTAQCSPGLTDCFGDASWCVADASVCGSPTCRAQGRYTCDDGVTCVTQLANCPDPNQNACGSLVDCGAEFDTGEAPGQRCVGDAYLCAPSGCPELGACFRDIGDSAYCNAVYGPRETCI